MSPSNSNKLKKFHFTTSQNNVTITVQKCSVFFSSFFFLNLCRDVLSILLKMSVLSFFLSFFFSYMLCSTMFKFLLFFFLRLFFSIVLYVFVFVSIFFLLFFFFSFFFHNKLLIQCPFFFQPYIYLSVFTLTITIGSLPSLFNFSL